MSKKENKKSAVVHGFYHYCLEKLNHTKYTSRYKNNCIGHYLQWLQGKGLKIKNMSYPDLLDYIGYLQSYHHSKGNINFRLKAISNYNSFLGVKDIAKQVILRGRAKSHGLYLNAEELKSLYENFISYNTKGHYLYSDKLILSLMVYQALDQRDIYALELHHLNLGQGTLYVPGNPRRKESRTLSLEAHQILPFKEYVDTYRKPYHKDHGQIISEKLFAPNCDKEHRLHDQIKLISKGLRQTADKMGIKITRLYNLRQSRIAIWLKQHGLRKAQYLAGYKTVASVELYQINDITDLQEQIKLLHPLGKQ
jgi:site-specific recombinase XerD